MCVCGCVRMSIVVMPDKLFVFSYKCTLSEQPKHTFFCLDLTHCQHATPITHKSECETVRDMQLCPGAPESLLIRLFTTLWIPLTLGTAGQELCLRLGPALFVADVEGRCRLLLCNDPLSHI